MNNLSGARFAFLADAQRSLASLRSAISGAPEELVESSLHAKDLSVALVSVGLVAPAEILSNLSTQFALKRVEALPVVLEFLNDCDVLLNDIASGSRSFNDMDSERWNSWCERLPLERKIEQGLVEQFGMIENKTPRQQDGLDNSVLHQSYINEGLRLIQEAREWNLLDKERTVLTVDAILMELQDWLLRQAQYPINDLYAPLQVIGTRCLVDKVVSEELCALDTFVKRARSVKVYTRFLNIYMDFLDLRVDETERIVLNEMFSRLDGRVEHLASHVRFIFPSSKIRARMTPFSAGDAQFVLFNAQVASYTPPDSYSAKGQIECVCGYTKYRVYVDSIGRAETMNLFSSPPKDILNKEVGRIAISGRSGAYELWTPRKV